MNIACYNLRFGGNANNRVHRQRIFEAAEPDIFLAQDTCRPDCYLTAVQLKAFRPRLHWVAVDNARWGSAIFVRTGRITSIVIPGYEGYILSLHLSSWPSASP